ncbi:unnamed protein product [Meganyctiphanes norvegica]|uniref:Protein CASP n=1 Tax=Meganyctiphanes norvegica TaxID=48144 RepID=A0AAV2QPL8_MEGNR
MAVKVQAVIGAWKSFELANVQRELDETATEVATRQDDSEASRKKLVELSREFKKTTSEDVRKQVSPLLKCFQTEIDSLNKRCKFSETAFLNVYKKVIDMIDPLPTLEYCVGLEKKVGKLADFEIENKNLRETLKDYNEEFKEVRNQDVTIKALKEKVKNYEDQMDETVQNKTKELEKELSRQYAEKARLLQETQETVVRRQQEAETRANSLQASLEQTQSELFEIKSKYEETSAAKSDETDMLMIDLDRSNQRAALAEKEAMNLREQMTELTIAYNEQMENIANSSVTSDMESSVDSMARSSLEAELTSKDKEISQLVEDIKNLQASLNTMRQTSSNQIQNLEEEMMVMTESIEKMENKIAQQKDYDEVKRELNIMKSVEFGYLSVTKDEDNNASPPPKPLEVLLLEKTKAQANEITLQKQHNVSLTQKVSDMEEELGQLRSLSAEQKNLIISLESDLSSIQSWSSAYRGEGEGCSSANEIVAEAAEASMTPTPPTVGSPPTPPGMPRTPTPVQAVGASGSIDLPSAADSLLPIVSAQRERFRQRNEELEGNLTAKANQVVLLQNELDNLRADNLKLYEKIRFLQSYQGKQGTGDSPAESRYSSQYEETLDPFSSFSRKEKLRKYASLSPVEKMMLSTGQFILGNKTARTVTFFYTAILHVLVFLTLYVVAHTESCKRDLEVECAHKFAEHMQQVHGAASFDHNHIH